MSNAIAYDAANFPVVVTSTIEEDIFSNTVHNRGEPIPAGQLPTLFDAMTRGAEADEEVTCTHPPYQCFGRSPG